MLNLRGVWFVSLLRCRLSVAALDNPLLLKADSFDITLNVTDHPHEHANRMRVDRGIGRGQIGSGP